MNFILQPWQLLLTILAGLITRQQQEVIDYLRAENQVLREAHGKRRFRLNDDQRRRLAVKGKVLGRKVLREIGTSFTPDTILRWHRQLVAEKWDYSDRRRSVGRPRVKPEIVELVLRIARENQSWGYDRIQGALANLGHKISDTTVGSIPYGQETQPTPKSLSPCRLRPHAQRPFRAIDKQRPSARCSPFCLWVPKIQTAGSKWPCGPLRGCGRHAA
jgi:hypothetical protein